MVLLYYAVFGKQKVSSGCLYIIKASQFPTKFYFKLLFDMPQILNPGHGEPPVLHILMFNLFSQTHFHSLLPGLLTNTKQTLPYVVLQNQVWDPVHESCPLTLKALRCYIFVQTQCTRTRPNCRIVFYMPHVKNIFSYVILGFMHKKENIRKCPT